MMNNCLAVAIIKTGGDVEVAKLEPGKIPDLDTLQKGVGGYIEVVPEFHKYLGYRAVAFCNEEGKLNNLPYNSTATWLWGSNEDVLVGDVVIVFGDPDLLDQL